MPLKPGRTDAAIDSNISEMMKSFKGSGSIGHTKPKSKKKAAQIAAAAAYRKAGRYGKK
jgi:hypothetical protein